MNETENKVVEVENEEAKKTNPVSGFFHKVADVGKRAVAGVQKGAKAISDKNKEDSYRRKLEKYRPVYLEDCENGEFYMPNMIVIEDDSRRRESDVYEKAIGWISKEKGTEVFHLFEDSIEKRFKFLPNLQCNAFYYMDSFDSCCFVRVDCVFARARDEKLAELKHIAHCLGAKSCSIEIVENRFEASGGKVSASVCKNAISKQTSAERMELNSGKIVSLFEGSESPKKPKLKWFSNDDNIKRLIEARCSGINTIKSETIELKGATSAAMSQKTACAIDAVVGGKSGKGSIESQAHKENSSTLIYSIEF